MIGCNKSTARRRFTVHSSASAKFAGGFRKLIGNQNFLHFVAPDGAGFGAGDGLAAAGARAGAGGMMPLLACSGCRGRRCRRLLLGRGWLSRRRGRTLGFALAETGLEIFSNLGLRMQCPCPRDENIFGFYISRIGHAHIDGANRGASLVIVKADALRAQQWVNDINGITLANCVIRAFGFAGTAINTISGNHRCHEKLLTKSVF
jgi:hypothetical protein